MCLEVKNVTKTYNGRTVLDNINLHIKDGEFVCILGASGCGKSTLLNMLAGLGNPSDGEILFDGRRVVKPGPERSYLFQEAALFPWLNVIDNVKYGIRMHGVPKAEQQVRALRFLEMVNLTGYEKYRIHELSGGMKQRAALARALTLDSRVLLMDEPFAALDVHTKEELRVHLLKIWQETGKTIVFVTHSIEEAFLLADRVVVMSTHPARILKEYRLHRPRDIKSLEFRAMMDEAERIQIKEVASVAN